MSFERRVKAAASALTEARAHGLDQVVVRDGPRGYSESVNRGSMRLTERQLRGIVEGVVNEDLLRGIPEFIVHEISRKAVAELQQHLKRHVFMISGSEQHTREALQACQEPLKKLGDAITELIEDRVWGMVQLTDL